jgi:hypothetical protein
MSSNGASGAQHALNCSICSRRMFENRGNFSKMPTREIRAMVRKLLRYTHGR